jgi:peptidoglycan/xylan/chitin deacetylase (PgdA/CDA1 family)
VATRNGVIPGLHSPSQMYEIWAGDFDYLHDRLDEGVYILTLHPQCIGRGHRLLMLERLIDYIRDRRGVTFKTMSEVALEFKKTTPLVPD